MALMSAKDFLANKDTSTLDAHQGYMSANDLPSNNTPTAKANITKSHGLISAADFKKSLIKPDVAPPTIGVSPDVQSFTDSINKPKFDIFHPDPNSALGKIQNTPNVQNTQKSGWNGIFDNPISRGIGEGWNGLNVLSQNIAKYATPDAPMFTKDGKLDPNMTARQQFLTDNPQKSTGNAAIDKTLDFGGQIGSMFVPMGTGGALINDVSKGTSALLGTRLGTALEGAGGNLASKGANLLNPALNQAGINLSTSLANKAGQSFVKGAALGAGYGAIQPLAFGSGNLSDVPKSVAENALMFGAGDALLPFAGAGLGKIGELLKKPVPLPSYSGLGLDSNLGGSPKYVQNQPSDYINSFKNLTNTEDIHSGLKEIDGHLSDLEKQYTQALDGQYSFLKDSLKNRQGVNQGGMIKDSNGDVIDRYGRTSNNPEWYQQFYKENNRLPTNKDLLNLAQQHVDEGFTDNGAKIPSWKDQTGYEDAKNSLTSVKSELNKSLSEMNGKKTSVNQAGEILNSSAKPNEPILLTPKQMAQQDRKDLFSKIENNPVIPDTSSQIQSKTIAEKTPFAQKVNNAYIKGVDNVHRLNEFDQKVAQVTGDLPASEQSHTLALNSRGSDMISRQILEHGMVDSQGNVTGGSFKSVVDQIPKGKQTEFEDYLVAQHSITRMGRGEGVYHNDLGMTVQKAQSKVAELEQANPDFKKAADSYYQYNQQLGKSWLVDTGLITPEQWDGYLAANPHYVPNQRIFSDLEKSQQFGSKGGFANQTAPIKKAEGSQRPIVRPIESTIENTAKYVKSAKQNEVMQALHSNILKDPEAFKDWAEIVHDQPKSNVTDLLHKEGPDGLLEEVAKSFDNATRKPDLTKGNIVSAFVNGERVHIKVNDPQLLDALTNLNPQGQHFVMDAIGKVTKTMKVLTTGANPVFSLTRNIFRDIPTAFISSKSTNNPVKFAYDMVHSVLSVMGNGELYNSFKNIGGGHSSSIAADRNLLAQSMEKILPSKGIGQTLKRTLITKPYHALENLNNALETAPRLAEYKRFSKDGSYDSKVSGLYQANDVTTNFNRFGNYTKQADALFPYLNAAVQGLDKTVRVFKDNPTAAFSKAAGIVAVPTILMYALNHNNPDYQQLSNFVKDNNFLIPKGDGTFLKIPKSREFGAMFSTPIERVLRQWQDHDPNAFQDFVHNFIQNVAPPGVGGAIQGSEQGGLTGAVSGVLQDTIAGPVSSLASNKDFANRPIVPQDLQKLSPQLQYDSKTSEPAKFLGSLINTSPKQLDFLAKSYLGVIGQLGLPLATKGGSIGETLKRQVTADPVFSNDISRNFYDAKNKADQAKADSKVTGEPLTKDLSTYYDRISNNLSSLRKMEKSVQKDVSLSNDEKNQKLKELTKQMNSILQQSILK